MEVTVKRSGVDYEERRTSSEASENQAERHRSSHAEDKTSHERHNDDCDEGSAKCHKNFEKTLQSSSQQQHANRDIYA